MALRAVLIPLVAGMVACGTPKEPDDTQPPVTSTGGTSAAPIPPNAQDDAAVVAEGATQDIAVSGNDLVTQNPLALGSVTIVSPPSVGDVTVNTDGSVTYSHDGSETTADSFTYTIEDNTGLASNVATVDVTVTPVNDPPVAVDDAGAVDERQTVRLDLAANDSDGDDGLDLASIAIVDTPTVGSVVVNADGTVDYTQGPGAATADSFTYTIDDGSGATSNVATVSMTITLTNDPPVALYDGTAVTEGGAVVIDVASNDFDTDDGLDLMSIQVTQSPYQGTTQVNGDGTITYTHNGSETLFDAFEYTISDLSGAPSLPAQVAVSVIPVNDVPVATNDAAAVNERGTVNVAVLANDTDVDGTLNPATVTITTAPTAGTAVVLPGGTVDYTHNGSQVTNDTFRYTVNDSQGATSNAATVTMTITLINDPPTAVDDAGTVSEGGLRQVNVAANDTDPDDGIDTGSVVIVANPTYGTLVVNGNGTVDYTHAGAESASDSFQYTIEDLGGNVSNVATVTMTVTPVNDPPTAVDDAVVLNEGGVVLIDLLANDVDPDDGLNAASVVVGGASYGSLVNNANGTVTYTHNGSETTFDTFSYTVRDLAGVQSNVAYVTLNVTPVNDPPTALNDVAGCSEGSSVVVSVLNNDSDPDDGLNSGSVVIVTAPTNGTATPQAGGTILYSHNGSETTLDTFTYRVSDFAGLQSGSATVTVNITPVNDLPVAVDDPGYVVLQGGNVNVNVASNDYDVDGTLNLASVTIVTTPVAGTVIVNGNGTVDYFHNGGATMADDFSYTIRDNMSGTSNVAWVDISVTPVGGGSCQNLGWKYGSDPTWACPAGYRMPTVTEYALVQPCLTAADLAYISYYHDIAVSVGGCNCKWNANWCGQPSIDTINGGRMCGDFDQLHICVQ